MNTPRQLTRIIDTVYQDEQGRKWVIDGAWPGERCQACGGELVHTDLLWGEDIGSGVTILCLPCSPLGGKERKSETARREFIYVASPVTCYETARYDVMLGYVTSHFLGAEILPARGLYTSTAHWLATWPKHLKRITAVVYFADTDGSIGRGVYKEIEDATARGLPVHYLTDSGDLIPHSSLSLSLVDGGESWRRYARVVKREQPKAAHPAKKAATPREEVTRGANRKETDNEQATLT